MCFCNVNTMAGLFCLFFFFYRVLTLWKWNVASTSLLKENKLSIWSISEKLEILIYKRGEGILLELVG